MLHMITKKTFKDPCMGDCEVARWFIHVEIEVAPWISNVPSPSVLPWKSRPEIELMSRDSVPYQSPVQSSIWLT